MPGGNWGRSGCRSDRAKTLTGPTQPGEQALCTGRRGLGDSVAWASPRAGGTGAGTCPRSAGHIPSSPAGGRDGGSTE